MSTLATLAKYAQQTAHTHFARITRPFISLASLPAPFKFLHYGEIKEEETRMEERRTSQSKAHSVPDRDRRQGHSQRTYSNFSVIDYNLDCSAMLHPYNFLPMAYFGPTPV